MVDIPYMEYLKLKPTYDLPAAAQNFRRKNPEMRSLRWPGEAASMPSLLIETTMLYMLCLTYLYRLVAMTHPKHMS